VRSVRRARKVVQETVAHLGELDGAGRARARRLARRITGRRERYELFEAATNGAAVAVRLDAIRLEWSRRFGDVWRVWCALELDRFCAAQMAEGASAWRGRRWRRSTGAERAWDDHDCAAERWLPLHAAGRKTR
jgi:hypothetical protein